MSHCAGGAALPTSSSLIRQQWTWLRLRDPCSLPSDSRAASRGLLVRAKQPYFLIARSFVINCLFSALLRGLGFQLTEHPARTFANRNKDPAEAGYAWVGTSHVVLLVIVGAETYVVDCGFGGGSCPAPVSLSQSSPLETITAGERFSIRAEPLPGAAAEPRPEPSGWTLYRHFAPSRDNINGLVSPVYHIEPKIMRPADARVMNLCVSLRHLY